MFYLLERHNETWVPKPVVRPSKINLVLPNSSVHFLRVPVSNISVAPAFILRDYEFLGSLSSLKVEEQLSCFPYLNQDVIVSYPVTSWYVAEVYEPRIRGTGPLHVQNQEIQIISLNCTGTLLQRDPIFSAIETQNALLFTSEISRFRSTPLFYYYNFVNAWKNKNFEVMYSNLVLYLGYARSDSIVRFVFALIMLAEVLMSTQKSHEAIHYLRNEYPFVLGYPPFETYIARFPSDVQRFIQGGA